MRRESQIDVCLCSAVKAAATKSFSRDRCDRCDWQMWYPVCEHLIKISLVWYDLWDLHFDFSSLSTRFLSNVTSLWLTLNQTKWYKTISVWVKHGRAADIWSSYCPHNIISAPTGRLSLFICPAVITQPSLTHVDLSSAPPVIVAIRFVAQPEALMLLILSEQPAASPPALHTVQFTSVARMMWRRVEQGRDRRILTPFSLQQSSPRDWGVRGKPALNLQDIPESLI